MKNRIIFSILCLLVTGCALINPKPTGTQAPSSPTSQPAEQDMVNPAAAFCEQKGYKSEIRTAADGSQSGVCIFPNGIVCDEWAFYRGECTPATPSGSMPNPASVFCEQQGYTVEIRTAGDGSQSGACIFPNGSECDEWAFFRGECKPAETPGVTPANSQDWQTYTNEDVGYSFEYPAGSQVTTNDDPLNSLYISGASMGSETWGIAHPSDRQDYRPPEGADLVQWLTDHNLMGEERLPDEQIAGTTAIHFRHPPSPQSYAFDTYYLANRGQLFQITIGHSSENEDWNLDNRFLQSFQFIEPTPSKPTAIPTALPIDPAAYQDWQTYSNQEYGFSLRIPDDWIVEEVSGGGPGLDGHLLNLRPVDTSQKDSIRLTFRKTGEDVLLWPTGVGEGEFISAGSLEIAGEPAQRMLLVCPAGEITSIWYHQAEDQPNLTRGNLEFGFIFSATPTHCEAGYSLSGKTQQLGETILSSLSVP